MSNAATPASVVSNEFGMSGFTLIISANTTNYNVYSQFVSAFGVPAAGVDLIVIVNPGVTVSATSTAAAALTWGNSWTGTPTFNLVNNGSILGAGGAGGTSATSAAINGGSGGAGGKAIELSGQTVSITNGSGSIWGGGGGGGGGAGITWASFGDLSPSTGFSAATSGGGGQGQAGGVATAVNPGKWNGVDAANNDDFSNANCIASFNYDNFSAGTNGSVSAAGDGGATNAAGTVACDTSAPLTPYSGVVLPGDGGAGGIWATSGSNGSAAQMVDATGTYTTAFTSVSIGTGGTGGAAGKAINLTSGTANFVSGSGSPNVKGAVS